MLSFQYIPSLSQIWDINICVFFRNIFLIPPPVDEKAEKQLFCLQVGVLSERVKSVGYNVCISTFTSSQGILYSRFSCFIPIA